MGYGDRPLPKKSAPPVAAKKSAPARTTVSLKVPDKSKACEFARVVAGKTFEPDSAPKLPLAGCGVIECRCKYEQVTDQRGKVRREKEERRDMIRFETKSGRREVGGDRRKSNTRWTGPR